MTDDFSSPIKKMVLQIDRLRSAALNPDNRGIDFKLVGAAPVQINFRDGDFSFKGCGFSVAVAVDAGCRIKIKKSTAAGKPLKRIAVVAHFITAACAAISPSQTV